MWILIHDKLYKIGVVIFKCHWEGSKEVGPWDGTLHLCGMVALEEIVSKSTLLCGDHTQENA
jgi:hypothetical protein